MNLQLDPNGDQDALLYPGYLLEFGEGTNKKNGPEIELPTSITAVDSSQKLIDCIFLDLEKIHHDLDWLSSRAILAPTNRKLQEINEGVSMEFPGTFRFYFSADSVVFDNPDDQKKAELNFPQELLNSVEAGSSLPDHEIKLKKDS